MVKHKAKFQTRKSDMSMRLESDAHNTQCITDNLARNKGKRRSECGVD